MRLGDAGQARVRGYMFVLGRSLRSFLPEAVALDALREIEGHIAERIAGVEAVPDERAALEAVLRDLGAPLEVARAYAGEMAIEEAVATGRLSATARALWLLATTTVGGFFATLGLFVGYVTGLAFLAIAVLKPIFPDRVGLLVVGGIPRGLGVYESIPPGGVIWGGYGVVLFAAIAGLLVLALTQRGTMRFLRWWRERRAPAGPLRRPRQE